MFNLILISCIFLIGFFVSPIYAVVISCFALFFNSPAKIRFKRIDIFIVIYVAIVSLFYMQLDKIPAIKETLIYVVGPFLFYFLGKSLLKSDIDERKLYLLITCIFVIYSCYIFFTDFNGNSSFSLSQNYYYNSRNNMLIKSELDILFINETNLSLLVLTSLFLVTYVIKQKLLKIVLFVLLFSMLLILASRTAVSALTTIILIYFIKFQNLKSKFFILLFGSLTFLILISTIDVFEIPYISTFFKRTLDKSFGESTNAYGLDTRFVYFLEAYQNSQALFEIKGYKNLLNTHGFSSHNEVLGHSSSTGILPTISYFIFIMVLVRNRLKMLELAKNLLFHKIFLALVICYFTVGLTENIYISNVVWIYFFLFTIGITTTNEINYDSKANKLNSKIRV